MCGITRWFQSSRVPHEVEKYLVLDVSNDICQKPQQSNLGYGVYSFNGDPIEQYIQTTDQILQQVATHRDNYPGNLCYTHGGLLHHRFKCNVSRLGLPVAGVAPSSGSLHTSHTALSLSDLNHYYHKLCTIIERIQL